MKHQHYNCIARVLPLLGIALAIAPAARAEQVPDPAAPFAWGEAIGWVNFDTGYVHLTSEVMSGYAWSESTGWINLGDGSPDSPPNYSNTSATDFGVNNDGSGGLSGYAWSESLGWIVFDTSSAGGSQVTVDGDGQMQGYAWSESAGWISMNSGYGVLLETVSGEGEEGEGTVEGGREGEGSVDGEGALEGEGVSEGEGVTEGSVEGLLEGEGTPEGEGAVDGEGGREGEGAVEGEGAPEGEGTVDGEGTSDGEGEGEEATNEVVAATAALEEFDPLDTDDDLVLDFTELEEKLRALGLLGVTDYQAFFDSLDSNGDGALSVGELRQLTPDSPLHGGDLDGDGSLDLTELLRAIQFYNAGRLGCAETAGDTEDGYAPGLEAVQCRPYTADYQPQDWALDLSELLRAIQLFNLQDIEYCPGGGEDGFCPKVD